MSQSLSGYTFYGTRCHSAELELFITHTLHTNAHAEANNRHKTPVCIWGAHGIGKTQIVEHYARTRGYQFVYIAPAQFEEMGDLLGMPKIVGDKTVFVQPEWVPTAPGPGILLIDDINRADDRILRGIMQLLQNYELVSWHLPAGWHIILTANPDGGDYSVTPLDFSIITRMLHITLTFDVKQWARWAEQAGIDSRGINFVLAYPETITGERTTPRTLVQFFDNIASIPDLKAELGLVKMLADASLDEPTVNAFVAFVNNQLSRLPTPEDILLAVDFDTEVAQSLRSVVEQDTKRVDILSIVCTRLVNYLQILKAALSPTQIENLKQFLLLDFLPNEMRLLVGQDLAVSDNEYVRAARIFADPRLGMLLLGKL